MTPRIEGARSLASARTTLRTPLGGSEAADQLCCLSECVRDALGEAIWRMAGAESKRR